MKPVHHATVTDPALGPDLDRLIAATTYALERARATADQAYARIRNLLTICVTFFGLTQTAAFAGLGANIDNKPLVGSTAQIVVGLIAAAALGVLALMARHVLKTADRGTRQAMVTAADLDAAVDQPGEEEETFGARVLGLMKHELRCWERANTAREVLVTEVTQFAAAVATLLVFELVALYVAI